MWHSSSSAVFSSSCFYLIFDCCHAWVSFLRPFIVRKYSYRNSCVWIWWKCHGLINSCHLSSFFIIFHLCLRRFRINPQNIINFVAISIENLGANYSNRQVAPDQLEKDGTLFHIFEIDFVVIKVSLDIFQSIQASCNFLAPFRSTQHWVNASEHRNGSLWNFLNVSIVALIY